MRLRFSIPGALVAGTYFAVAMYFAAWDLRHAGMGFGLLLASMPESLLLLLLPESFLYSQLWGFLLLPFVFGSMALNTFVLYAICGGVTRKAKDDAKLQEERDGNAL